MKKNLTVQVTDEEKALIEIHKALLQCDDWAEYIIMLAHFPRHMGTKDYGKPEDAKSLTIRFRGEQIDKFEYVNSIRVANKKTWRTFILEAVYGDEIREVLNVFRKYSKIMLNYDIDEVMA